jgi:hypothetical protein
MAPPFPSWYSNAEAGTEAAGDMDAEGTLGLGALVRAPVVAILGQSVGGDAVCSSWRRRASRTSRRRGWRARVGCHSRMRAP